MSDLNIIKPKCVQNIINKFCFTIGMIPTSYKISLTYEEQILAIGKYLEEVVFPAINYNAEALTELQELFVDLKNYVENYFDNLDVQEEINKKLDEMAESGELIEIISAYLNSKAIFGFDNVSSLKSSENLINGSIAETLGYYSKNDGGSALYKIRNITNDDIVDEKFIIALNDENLIAELIIKDNTLNIKQIGGRSLDSNNIKYDIKPYIDSYLLYLNNTNKKIKLYIPAGIYFTSPVTIARYSGFNIYGDYTFVFNDNGIGGTIISSLNDNQSFIFSVGNNEIMTHNWRLENINFTTSDFIFNTETEKFEYGNIKTITDECLIIKKADSGFTDKLMFTHIKGRALTITTVWETIFNLMNFRYVDALEKEVILFDSVISDGGNISSCDFKFIEIERTLGNAIRCARNCQLSNNHFGNINFEDNTIYSTGYTAYNEENQETEVTSMALIKIDNYGEFGNTVDNLTINNFPKEFYTRNGINYTYDKLIALGDNGSRLYAIFNNIHFVTIRKNIDIINCPSNNSTDFETSLIINNIMINRGSKNAILNVKQFPYIRVNNFEKGRDIVTHNLSDFNEFYKATYPSETMKGRIFYNNDAINNEKLVIRTSTDNEHKEICRITGTANNLRIRAKSAEGTFGLKIECGDHSATVNITGDGTFKMYEITDLATKLGIPVIGEELILSWASGSYSTYFDVYKFF